MKKKQSTCGEQVCDWWYSIQAAKKCPCEWKRAEIEYIVKRAIASEREALLREIISGIEDMQMRVRLEQFTVDEIIWLIKKKI